MSDLQEIRKQARKEVKKLKEQYSDKNKENGTHLHKEDYHESPYTIEDGTATFFYIIVMVIGTLFVSRWFIYIAATFIYIMFKRRHKKKK